VSDADLDDALAQAARRPDDVAARIRAAYALDRVGREAAAIIHYDAAWSLGVPADQRRRFVVGYGSTLRNVGRLEQSVALLGEASAADPDYAPYKAFLSLALHSSGEHAAALATMTEVALALHAGATLDGFERALAEYQRELLDLAIARAR
jgi:tetratricopeptide (TPR) repeat protein